MRRKSAPVPHAHDGTTQEVPLDVEQVHAAWNALKQRYVSICVGRVARRLFRERSIVARRGTERLAMTDNFANYVRRWLAPYARDVLDAILVLGVVPVRFKRLATGDWAPYVPAYPGYTITTSLENGLQQFKFYWRTPPTHDPGAFFALDGAEATSFGAYDPHVYILSDFGANPMADGTLRSPLAACLPEIAFINEMLEAAVNAERVRSMPPIMFQEAPQRARSMASGLEEGVFGGDVDAVERRELSYTRSREQQREFERQLSAYTSITGRSGHAMMGVRERHTGAVRESYAPNARDARGHLMPWTRTAFVPEEHVLATLPTPAAPANLSDMIERVQRTICGVMAVPAAHTSSVASDRLRASADASEAAMNDTAQYYSAMLSRALNVAYEHAFGRADFLRELRSRAEERHRRRLALTGRAYERDESDASPMLTEDDFFAAVASTSIELTFDLSPTTDAETLDALNARGILDWSNYAAARLQLADLPPSLAPERDPFTDDERKRLLPGYSAPSDDDAQRRQSKKPDEEPPKKKAKRDRSSK